MSDTPIYNEAFQDAIDAAGDADNEELFLTLEQMDTRTRPGVLISADLAPHVNQYRVLREAASDEGQ